MKVKQKFATRIEVYKLPCVVIRKNPLSMHEYDSVLKMLNTDEEICDRNYISSSIQIDIEGKDSFIIIFTD